MCPKTVTAPIGLAEVLDGYCVNARSCMEYPLTTKLPSRPLLLNELGRELFKITRRFYFGERAMLLDRKTLVIVVDECLYVRVSLSFIEHDKAFRGYCFRRVLCYYPKEHRVRERPEKGLVPTVAAEIAREHRRSPLTPEDCPTFLFGPGDWVVRRRYGGGDGKKGEIVDRKHVPSTPLTNFYLLNSHETPGSLWGPESNFVLMGP